MSDSPENRPTMIKTLIRLAGYFKSEKGLLVVVFLLFLIGISAFLLISVLFGQAVNLISAGGPYSTLHNMALLTVLMSGITFVTLVFAFRGLAVIAQNALYLLRKELFSHMQTLSLNFFDRQPIGELMSRVTNDIDTIIALFQNPLGVLIMGQVMLVLTIIAMLVLNPFLTLVALIAIPLLLGFVYILAKVAAPAFELLQSKLADLNGVIEESLAGERTVIAYRRQEAASEKLDGISEQAREIGARAQLLSLISNPFTTMCTYFDIGVVALVGSVMVMRGTLSVGDLASFISLTLLFIFPLYSTFANYNFLLSAVIGAGRIFAIIDEKPDIADRPGARPIKPVKGNVVFEDVDFSYIKGRKILRKNSFEAKPGEMIGLCGPTGAGKSTIINILTRYYDIDSGRITIDGQDIYDVTIDSLRSEIGVVLQEPFLFTDTVMNNLRYGRDGATDEECINAAKEANCDEFIRRLQAGYNTLLVDGGSNLSQGQRQLLTIARLMVAHPGMIILDEATSNVDTRTERSIQKALSKLQEGRTSFVIAHRLSTIRNADKILVINEGEIVEQGNHEELMSKRGFYYNLFMSQFKGKISEILPDEN